MPGIVITLTPTATAPITRLGRAAANANLRAGPGMGYRVIAWAVKGDELEIIGTSPDDAWSQLANGLWIATWLVQFDGVASE